MCDSLFAEAVDDAPVGVRHAEPLAVAGPDVDVDGAEVVVLLVARRPAARHLQKDMGGRGHLSMVVALVMNLKIMKGH